MPLGGNLVGGHGEFNLGAVSVDSEISDFKQGHCVEVCHIDMLYLVECRSDKGHFLTGTISATPWSLVVSCAL